MNSDFIIDKFFETKLVKGFPACPDCPPEPCTGDCCEGGDAPPGPCPCCDGGGPPGGPGGGGSFGDAPGGEVDTQEVENFLMAVGESPMSDVGPCPDCDSCGGGGGGGGGIPVNITPYFIPQSPEVTPPPPGGWPWSRPYQEIQWCIGNVKF